MKTWVKSGSPWIWLSASAVSVSLIMVVGLIGLIAVRGLGIYWPSEIHQFEVKKSTGEQEILIGEIYDEETVSRNRLADSGIVMEGDAQFFNRTLFKIGNRDVYGVDFRWVLNDHLNKKTTPEDIVVFERLEWGNLYGYVENIKQNGQLVQSNLSVWEEFETRLERVNQLHDEIKEIEKHEIGSVNYALERLRLKKRKHELNGTLTDAVLLEMQAEEETQKTLYQGMQSQLQELTKKIQRDVVSVKIATGSFVELPLANIARAFKPNAMNFLQKAGFYAHSAWLFVTDEPREANTEGGIFPAIFGTVMMVLIMSIIVTPVGIIAAVYLKEYATQGFITRVIRIAVNNLAGVPSIVYGVFGLGFFVYFLGGNIDQLFFPEALPAPTFGTSGILWASLTLAILTVPVVIVATEEGLSRVPKNIREGSLALGATKWETLWKTVLPMASPAMMTGLILAVARAAGEVAPLMLVGVVKLAPSLPLDENFPFLHLDRKFMHLGFHIYDVGFQSPNVEAARPLVYATAFLLIVVIIILNLTAISVRNRLREKYKSFDH